LNKLLSFINIALQLTMIIRVMKFRDIIVRFQDQDRIQFVRILTIRIKGFMIFEPDPSIY